MKVYDKQCDQCLFSKNRIVSAARVKQIIRDCHRQDTQFQCHKATMRGEDVQCRGYYDSQPPSQMTRIAGRLNMLRFVPLPAEKDSA